MARYERLMICRKVMINDITNLARIDLDIAMAFELQAAEAIERRLHQVTELAIIKDEMMKMDLPASQFKACISRIFSTEGYQKFDDDVDRWKDLMKAWEQMTEVKIDTSHVRRRLTTVFEVCDKPNGFIRLETCAELCRRRARIKNFHRLCP